MSLRLILIHHANIFESTLDRRKKMLLTIVENRVEYRETRGAKCQTLGDVV